MKLYLNTKKMTFDEEKNKIEHEVIISILDKDFIGCDYSIELPINNQFIRDTFKIEKIGKDEIRYFKTTEDSWNSFPLYQFKDNKIIPFNYAKYKYFNETNRRTSLASKIGDLYNSPSEAKIIRKTLKYIINILDIECPDFFEKYNRKIEDIIKKNPKI